MPPVNDAVAGALEITGDVGTLTFSNVGATEQTGEPKPFSSPSTGSVWFKWTAPADGHVKIGTYFTPLPEWDSAIDVIQFSAWPDISGWTEVSGDDDSHLQDGAVDTNYGTSEVTFFAHVGQTYYIRVDAWDETGFESFGPTQRDDLVLSWQREISGSWGPWESYSPAYSERIEAPFNNARVRSKVTTTDNSAAGVDAAYAAARATPPQAPATEPDGFGVETDYYATLFSGHYTEVTVGHQGGQFATALPSGPGQPPEVIADPTIYYENETTTDTVDHYVEVMAATRSTANPGGYWDDQFRVFSITKAQEDQALSDGAAGGWSGMWFRDYGLLDFIGSIATGSVGASTGVPYASFLAPIDTDGGVRFATQIGRVVDGANPDMPAGLGGGSNSAASCIWQLQVQLRSRRTFSRYHLWTPGDYAPFPTAVPNLAADYLGQDIEYVSRR